MNSNKVPRTLFEVRKDGRVQISMKPRCPLRSVCSFPNKSKWSDLKQLNWEMYQPIMLLRWHELPVEIHSFDWLGAAADGPPTDPELEDVTRMHRVTKKCEVIQTLDITATLYNFHQRAARSFSVFPSIHPLQDCWRLESIQANIRGGK